MRLIDNADSNQILMNDVILIQLLLYGNKILRFIILFLISLISLKIMEQRTNDVTFYNIEWKLIDFVNLISFV